MFRSARLKLTAWYVLIIMLISFVFSLGIYRSVTFELERRFNAMEWRMRAGGMRFMMRNLPPHEFFIEDLQAAKNRVLIALFYTNGLILLFSGAAAYFLAGKTLKPIEEAMKEQERFVSDASHELRTPLTALKTSIEVALRDKKLNLKEAKKVLKENLEDVDELEALTSGLLSLAQTSQPEKKYFFSEIDLAQVAKGAISKLAPLAKKKKVRITQNLKTVLVKADRESIERLMVIMLDNSIKYTEEGGLVSISTNEDKKNAIFKISDTGIGIPEKEIPHIFDRFYRVDTSRSKVSAPGFGLGLSIAKKIVDAHGGSIKVTSEVSKGTIFKVILPKRHS